MVKIKLKKQTLNKNKTLISQNKNNIFNEPDEITNIIEKKELSIFEREYNDNEIFIYQLENDFLSQIPIEDQNNQIIQKEISNKISLLLELNKYVKKLLQRDNNYTYIYDNFLKNNFNCEFIIPIISDKIKINDNIEYLTKYLTEYHLIINEEYKHNKINFSDLQKKLFALNNIYEIDEKIKGFEINMKNNTHVLRYENINKTNWNNRIVLGDLYTYKDIYDEKTKKIKETQKKIISLGEKINIIGFYLLDRKYKNLNEYIENGYDKIGDIEEINKSEKTIITIKNHGLVNSEYIYIIGINFNGYFNAEIIDKNKFYINYDTRNIEIKKPYGGVYAKIKLKYIENIKNEENESRLILLKNNEIDYKKIVPNLSNIINEKYLNVTTINELDDYIKYYQYNINLLRNIDIKIIKKILKKNLEKKIEEINKNMKSIEKIKENNENNKKLINDSDILNDKLFYDKKIVELYGEYSLKNNINDNIYNRLLWMRNHLDYGIYYINYCNKNNKKENISNLITNIENELKIKQKNYEKEISVDKYFNICEEKEFNTLDELKKDNKKYNKVYIKSLNEIYQWNGKEYIKLNIYRYLCSLNENEIENISNINCIYTLDGCKSKKTYRLEELIKLMEKSLKNMKGYMENNNIYEKYLNRYETLLSKKIIKKEIVENIERKITNDMDLILLSISKIENAYIKKKYLYKLIDLDGILIDNYYYSKKFMTEMICGHFQYLRKEEYENNNERIKIIHEKLLERYGDSGKGLHGYISCKYCGEILDKIPEDSSPGFDEDGQPIGVKEEYVKEDEIIQKKINENLQKIDCHDINFKESLKKYGYKNEQIDLGIKTCEILTKIINKIGLFIPRNHIMDMIYDIIEKLMLLQSPTIFIKKVLKTYKDRGIDEKKIDRKQIESGYNKYLLIKKYVIIASRLLINLQTNEKPYKIEKKNNNCSFDGWDGKNGVEYMACILNELNILLYKDITGKEIKVKTSEIIDEIFTELKLFKLNFKIKKLYLNKKNIIKKDTEYLNESIKYIPNETQILNFNKKNIKLNDYNSLFQRNKYINYNIVQLLDNLIKGEEPLEEFKTFNYCCLEPLNKSFLNFKLNDEIKKKNYEKLLNFISESKEIINYYPYFINKGIITRFIFKKNRLIGNIEKYTLKIINDNIINKTKMLYCFIGNYIGELHNFLNNKICSKCLYDIKKIQNTKLSNNDYEKLLLKINLNKLKQIKIYPNYKYLENKNNQDLDKYVKLFVSKLIKLNGIKDENIENDLLNKINDLGLYNKKFNTNKNKNIKQENIKKYIFNHQDEKFAYGLQLIKHYFNQYFRKFFSIIANYDEKKDIYIYLDIENELKKHYQELLIEENNIIQKFMNDEYKSIIMKLKFKYNSDELNNIYGRFNQFDHNGNEIKNNDINVKNAYEYLKSILISELNRFIDETKNNDDKIKISEVILHIFKIIFDDDMISNVSGSETEKYERIISHMQFCKAEELVKGSSKGSAVRDSLKLSGVEIESDDEEVAARDLIDFENNEVEKENNERKTDNELETIAKEKLGKNATATEIEEYKEKLKKKQDEDEEINEEIFNTGEHDEFNPFLEVGDNYGEMPQGTEDGQQGFSEYSAAEFEGVV